MIWHRGQFETEMRKDLPRVDEGKTFFQNSIVRSLLLIQGVLMLASLSILTLFIQPIGAISVLHYNVYFGVDLLGTWWQTGILPLVALIFASGNLGLAYRLYMVTRDRIAAYLVLFGSLMLFSGVLLGCAAVAYINY